MLQPIISKIKELENLIDVTLITEDNVKVFRNTLIVVLHDLLDALNKINEKVDHELTNGKYTVIRESIQDAAAEMPEIMMRDRL
jgi:nitrogen regulatory protein PII-like uncharacterized protein